MITYTKALAILKQENNYHLEFTRPEKYEDPYHWGSSRIIAIRFRNSGSYYEPFNVAFMRMFNSAQKLKEKIMPFTLAILNNLYRDYWASEEERKKILEKEKYNSNILEEEKRKIYFVQSFKFIQIFKLRTKIVIKIF